MAYVYIIECNDKSYYTGIATDVKRRIREHSEKAKVSAKYTRAKGVSEVLAVWETESLSTAGKLEYYIKKKLTREKKKLLIEDERAFTSLVSDEIAEHSYKRIYGITLNSCIEEEKQEKN